MYLTTNRRFVFLLEQFVITLGTGSFWEVECCPLLTALQDSLSDTTKTKPHTAKGLRGKCQNQHSFTHFFLLFLFYYLSNMIVSEMCKIWKK